MRKYVFIFFVSLLFYVIRAGVSGHAIYGDANAYWSHAHAIFFKGNLDYSEIYQHLSNFQGKKYVFSRVFWETTPLINEQLRNPWLVGPALLWMPLMAVFWLALYISRIFLSPYELVWEIVAGVSSMLFAIYGLYLNEKTLKKFFTKRASALAVFIIFYASNLFYYISLEPAHSHSVIFFLNSLFVYYIFSLDFDKKMSWLRLAFVGGLSTITRMSGVLVLVIALGMLIRKFKDLVNKERQLVILYSFFGFLLGILPQLVVQKIIYGSIIYQPYLFGEHGGGFHLYFSLIPKALFSVERGLFLWSPVLFFGLIGLVYWKKHIQIRNVFIVYLITFVLIIGSWEGILSAGYGNRFFVDCMPVFAFGLASFIQMIKSKKALTFLAFSMILWNVLLVNQFFYDKGRLVDLKNITYRNFLFGMVETPFKIIRDLGEYEVDRLIRIRILD